MVSHQNVDHIGLIPALVKRGFKGDIIGSYKSLEFSKKLLSLNKKMNYLNIHSMKETKMVYFSTISNFKIVINSI